MTPTKTKLNSKPPGVRQDNKVFCEFVAKAKDHLLKGEADCEFVLPAMSSDKGSRWLAFRHGEDGGLPGSQIQE
jgi:hypothetical protein